MSGVACGRCAVVSRHPDIALRRLPRQKVYRPLCEACADETEATPRRGTTPAVRNGRGSGK